MSNSNIDSVTPILDKFLACVQDANARYRASEEVFALMAASMLARENIILIGPPGCGKTGRVEALAGYIRDGKHVSIGLCKSSTDSDLYGGPDVPHLVGTGGYRRNTNGFLPTATTALLDEAFKAEGNLLQSGLRLFSEREFEGKEIPLLWAAIASNELPPELRGATNGIPADLGPLEESLLAFFDRFFYTVMVAPLEAGTQDWNEVVFGGVSRRADPTVGVTTAEVRALQAAVPLVSIPESVAAAIRELAVNLPMGLEGVADSQVTVSPRTWVKAIHVLKAHALLGRRSEVRLSDLRHLEHAFWITPDQRSVIAAQIGRVLSNKMSEADSSRRRSLDYQKAWALNMLISDSDSPDLVSVVSHTLAKDDPRAATAEEKLIEFCVREEAAHTNSLEDAEGDDADAIKEAIRIIKDLRTRVSMSVATKLKSAARAQARGR